MNLRRVSPLFFSWLFALHVPLIAACSADVEHPVQTVNLRPVIGQMSQSSESVYTGATVDLMISATDPEAAALTFTWSASGGALGTPVTTASQSEIAWIAPPVSGAFTVTATVKDAGGQQLAQDFTINVMEMVAGQTVVLASGQHQPGSIAVDATSVYWINASSSNPMGGLFADGAVMKCGLGGCGQQPTTLAKDQASPYTLTIDATDVYWANTGINGLGTDGSLKQCAIGGCGLMPGELVGGIGPPTLAVDANNIYWTITGNGAGSVWQRALGGGMPEKIADVPGIPFNIVVSATTLLWSASLSTPGVWQCSPPGNCMPTQMASYPKAEPPGAIAVDATNAYWVTGTSVVKCALSGCNNAPTTLVSDLTQPYAIATDGTNVYWTTIPMGQGGAVMKCAVGGCAGAPTTLANGPDMISPGAIAVDATSVYWTDFNAGTVMKTAK